MKLPEGEPDLGPWAPRPARSVAEELVVRVGAHRSESGRGGPLVVAVDGRSGSGKSTLAALLIGQFPDACVVPTDQVAWCHDFFAWDDLLVTGVLAPAGRGEAVAYRPPAWVREGREGVISVPASTRLLVVEGVGAARRALVPYLDAAVWVQSDEAEAYRRGIARDVELGRSPAQAEDFWAEWAAAEEPFLEVDRPWERADVVGCGTPLATGVFPPPGTVLVGQPAEESAGRETQRRPA